MGEFVKPLRRKIGVVTLMVACVFTAGWIFSPTFAVNFKTTIGHATYSLISARSEIRVSVITLNDHQLVMNSPNLVWGRIDAGKPSELGTDGWKWKWAGFEIGDREHDVWKLPTTYVIIPYWFIVITVTLLSAYLILSKPPGAKSEIIPPTSTGPDKDPALLRLLKWQQITDQTLFTVGSSILGTVLDVRLS